MPFRFGLQPLLDARAEAEDDARAGLMAAARLQARARDDAAALRVEFGRGSRAFAKAAREQCAHALRDVLTELDLLRTAIERTDALVRRRSADVVEARTTFTAAQRERRQVEVLRDRARAAFRLKAERREAAALDEANASCRAFT